MKQTLLKLSMLLMLTLGTAMGADMPGAAGGDETKAMSQAWIKAQLVLPSGEVSSTKIDYLLYDPNCRNVALGDMIANEADKLGADSIVVTEIRQSNGQYAAITDEQIETLWATIIQSHPNVDRAAGLAGLPLSIAASFLCDSPSSTNSSSSTNLPTAPYTLSVHLTVDPLLVLARNSAKLLSMGTGEDEGALVEKLYALLRLTEREPQRGPAAPKAADLD